MKTILKIIWISLLSTVVKVLTQVLVDDNFLTFLSPGEPRIEPFHIEYLIINIVVFVVLTIIFIYGRKYIPVSKLFKGVVYSFSITLIWFALKFEPNSEETIYNYFLNILIFFIPMMIYGLFLGYLSDEKTSTYKIKENILSSVIYLSSWIFLRIIYIVLEINQASFKVFTGTLWLVLTGTAIGLVFGLLYDMSKLPKRQTLHWIFIFSLAVFPGYYLSEYTINKLFNPYRFLAVSLDVLAIIISTLISFKVFKKEDMTDTKITTTKTNN